MHKKVLSIIALSCIVSAQSMDHHERIAQERAEIRGMDLIATTAQERITLHSAIKGRNIFLVKELLSQGYDLEHCDSHGATPLVYAAYLGHTDSACLICNAGANPNALLYEETPLHYAALNDDVKLAQLLVHKGAFLNAQDKETGLTPLHNSATTRRTATTQLLCEEGTDVTLKSSNGKTPLDVALESNAFNTLAVLLMHDGNRADYLLPQALRYNDSHNVARLLIREGVKISNQTPDVQEKVKLLFEPSSLTFIMLTRPIRYFKYLLSEQSQLDLNNLKDALIIAYAQDYLEHASELENRMQESPSDVREVHYSALKSAVARGNAMLCALLLEKLRKPQGTVEYSLLLNIAVKLGHHDIAQLLLPYMDLSKSLKNPVMSCQRAVVETLLNAGAKTQETEEFIQSSIRNRISQLHEDYYSNLLRRITAHRETLLNPTTDLRLSLLPRDVREYVIGHMVKTQHVRM